MLRKIGLSSRFAFSKASGPQAYQSTGLCWCCKRYGDFSRASRFVCVGCDWDSVVFTADLRSVSIFGLWHPAAQMRSAATLSFRFDLIIQFPGLSPARPSLHRYDRIRSGSKQSQTAALPAKHQIVATDVRRLLISP